LLLVSACALLPLALKILPKAIDKRAKAEAMSSKQARYRKVLAAFIDEIPENKGYRRIPLWFDTPLLCLVVLFIIQTDKQDTTVHSISRPTLHIMNQFIQRVANYVANKVIVKGLANSRSFQKFAVRTNKQHTETVKQGT